MWRAKWKVSYGNLLGMWEFWLCVVEHQTLDEYQDGIICIVVFLIWRPASHLGQLPHLPHHSAPYPLLPRMNPILYQSVRWRPWRGLRFWCADGMVQGGMLHTKVLKWCHLTQPANKTLQQFCKEPPSDRGSMASSSGSTPSRSMNSRPRRGRQAWSCSRGSGSWITPHIALRMYTMIAGLFRT